MKKRNYPGKKATLAWSILGSLILAYDVWAIRNGHETLSGAFWRGLENPKSRWPLVIVWGILTKHLIFPDTLEEYDPLRYLAGGLRREGLERNMGFES